MSNLFDILHSESATETIAEVSSATYQQLDQISDVEHSQTEPSDGGVTEDSLQQEEEVLDINAFKTKFTIPKKKTKQRQIFESICIDSRQFQHDVSTILRQSYKDRNADGNFVYTRCQLVHCEPLIKEYSEKRKSMKKDGYSDKETQDTYVFVNCETEADARLLCTEGVKVNNSHITCLGNPELGVYMSKHADLISPSAFRPGQFGRVIVFRAMKGKVKSMVENRSGTPLDPTPNYDCHVSKMASVDLSSTSPQYAFESNQIYFYEYDDCFEIVQRPRQLVPYCLIHFRFHYGESSKKLRLPPQLTPINIKASSGSQPPRSSSSSRHSHTSSKRPALLPTPPTIPSPSQQTTTPSPPAGGSHHSGKGKSQEKSAPSLPVVKTRVGKDVESGLGVIVWTGQLANGEVNLCTVDMLAYGTAIKPALFGQQLTITKMLPWTTVMTVLFNNLLTLPKNTETIAAGRYFSYYKIVPAIGEEDILRTIIVYFQQKESAGYIDLEEVKGILLPNCQITQNLGLSTVNERSDILHCVFISSQSRQQLLKGRVSVPNGTDNMANGGFSTYSIVTSTASSGGGKGSSISCGTVTSTPSPTGPYDQESLDTEAVSENHGNMDMPPLTSMSGSILFRDPPRPRRVSGLSLHFPDPDFFYEGGFKTVPPSTCLATYRVLFREFVDQMALQDKRNIDVARGKYRHRVTATHGPSLLRQSPTSKSNLLVEPNVTASPSWGKSGNLSRLKKVFSLPVSSMTELPTFGVPESLPVAAASHRDPRVQRRKSKNENLGLPALTSTESTSIKRDSLSAVSKVNKKNISTSPKPSSVVSTGVMSLEKKVNVQCSTETVGASDTSFDLADVSQDASNDGIVSGFGTAQTFDFIPEDVNVVSPVKSDVDVKTSVLKDKFDDKELGIQTVLSESKATMLNRNNEECVSNTVKLIDSKSLCSEVKNLPEIKSDTIAITGQSNSGDKITAEISDGAFFTEETKQSSETNKLILNVVKSHTSTSSVLKPSVIPEIEPLSEVSVTLVNKKVKTFSPAKSIIGLPLPPGEVLSEKDIIIDKPEKVSLSVELYVPGSKSKTRHDSDSDQEMPDDLIHHIVKKAPLDAKKKREIVDIDWNPTEVENELQEEVESSEVKSESTKIRPDTVSPTDSDGLPDWVMNPSLLDDDNGTTQSDNKTKVVVNSGTSVSESRSVSERRRHSTLPDCRSSEQLATINSNSPLPSVSTPQNCSYYNDNGRISSKKQKSKISSLMFSSKKIYKNALKLKTKKQFPHAKDKPMCMLRKLQRKVKMSESYRQSKKSEVITMKVKTETIWTSTLSGTKVDAIGTTEYRVEELPQNDNIQAKDTADIISYHKVKEEHQNTEKTSDIMTVRDKNDNQIIGNDLVDVEPVHMNSSLKDIEQNNWSGFNVPTKATGTKSSNCITNQENTDTNEKAEFDTCDNNIADECSLDSSELFEGLICTSDESSQSSVCPDRPNSRSTVDRLSNEGQEISSSKECNIDLDRPFKGIGFGVESSNVNKNDFSKGCEEEVIITQEFKCKVPDVSCNTDFTAFNVEPESFSFCADETINTGFIDSDTPPLSNYHVQAEHEKELVANDLKSMQSDRLDTNTNVTGEVLKGCLNVETAQNSGMFNYLYNFKNIHTEANAHLNSAYNGEYLKPSIEDSYELLKELQVEQDRIDNCDNGHDEIMEVKRMNTYVDIQPVEQQLQIPDSMHVNIPRYTGDVTQNCEIEAKKNEPIVNDPPNIYEINVIDDLTSGNINKDRAQEHTNIKEEPTVQGAVNDSSIASFRHTEDLSCQKNKIQIVGSLSNNASNCNTDVSGVLVQDKMECGINTNDTPDHSAIITEGKAAVVSFQDFSDIACITNIDPGKKRKIALHTPKSKKTKTFKRFISKFGNGHKTEETMKLNLDEKPNSCEGDILNSAMSMVNVKETDILEDKIKQGSCLDSNEHTELLKMDSSKFNHSKLSKFKRIKQATVFTSDEDELPIRTVETKSALSNSNVVATSELKEQERHTEQEVTKVLSKTDEFLSTPNIKTINDIKIECTESSSLKSGVNKTCNKNKKKAVTEVIMILSSDEEKKQGHENEIHTKAVVDSSIKKDDQQFINKHEHVIYIGEGKDKPKAKDVMPSHKKIYQHNKEEKKELPFQLKGKSKANMPKAGYRESHLFFAELEKCSKEQLHKMKKKRKDKIKEGTVHLKVGKGKDNHMISNKETVSITEKVEKILSPEQSNNCDLKNNSCLEQCKSETTKESLHRENESVTITEQSGKAKDENYTFNNGNTDTKDITTQFSVNDNLQVLFSCLKGTSFNPNQFKCSVRLKRLDSSLVASFETNTKMSVKRSVENNELTNKEISDITKTQHYSSIDKTVEDIPDKTYTSPSADRKKSDTTEVKTNFKIKDTVKKKPGMNVDVISKTKEKVVKKSEKRTCSSEKEHKNEHIAEVRAALAKIAKRQYEGGQTDCEPTIKKKCIDLSCSTDINVSEKSTCLMKISQFKRIPKKKPAEALSLSNDISEIKGVGSVVQNNVNCVLSMASSNTSEHSVNPPSAELLLHNVPHIKSTISDNNNICNSIKHDNVLSPHTSTINVKASKYNGSTDDGKDLVSSKSDISKSLTNSDKANLNSLINCNKELRNLKFKFLEYLKNKYIKKYGFHVEIVPTSSDISPMSPPTYKGDDGTAVCVLDLQEARERDEVHEKPSEEDVLCQSVLSALHSQKKGSITREPSTQKEKEFTEFWSLAIHYLLPLLSVADAELKETDKTKNDSFSHTQCQLHGVRTSYTDFHDTIKDIFASTSNTHKLNDAYFSEGNNFASAECQLACESISGQQKHISCTCEKVHEVDETEKCSHKILLDIISRETDKLKNQVSDNKQSKEISNKTDTKRCQKVLCTPDKYEGSERWKKKYNSSKKLTSDFPLHRKERKETNQFLDGKKSNRSNSSTTLHKLAKVASSTIPSVINSLKRIESVQDLLNLEKESHLPVYKKKKHTRDDEHKQVAVSKSGRKLNERNYKHKYVHNENKEAEKEQSRKKTEYLPTEKNLRQSSKNRFHPYKKEVQFKALKTYRDYQQLPNMSQSNYKSKVESFRSAVRDLLGKKLYPSEGRFLNYYFKRSTLTDVDEAKRIGDRDEKEEFKWSEKDVLQFHEKAEIVKEDELKGTDNNDCDLETSVYEKGEEQQNMDREKLKSTNDQAPKADNKTTSIRNITEKSKKPRESRPRSKTETGNRDEYAGRRQQSSSRHDSCRKQSKDRREKFSSRYKGTEDQAVRKETKDEVVHRKFKEAPASPTESYNGVYLTSTPSLSPSDSLTDILLESDEIASPQSQFERFADDLLDVPSEIVDFDRTNDINMTYYKKNVMSRPGRGWPILEIVDIPKAVPDYQPSKEGKLPSLLERQIVSSRDPRMNSSLPGSSVYNKPIEYEHVLMMDDPEEPADIAEPDEIAEPDPESNDIENLSFHSDDWCEKESENTAQDNSPVKVKVHVNPKFFPKLLRSPSYDVIPDDDWILAQQDMSPPNKETRNKQNNIDAEVYKEVKKSKGSNRRDKSPRIIPFEENCNKDTKGRTKTDDLDLIHNKSDEIKNKENKKSSIDMKEKPKHELLHSSKDRKQISLSGELESKSLKRSKDISSAEACFKREPEKVQFNNEKITVSRKMLQPLSQYSLSSVKTDHPFKNSTADRIMSSYHKDVVAALDKVSKGKKSLYDPKYKHLSHLSLATQIEISMLPDCATVKQLHLAALKDWQKAKPLDVLISGRYRFPDIKEQTLKPSLKTESVALQCKEDFSLEVYKLTKGSEYKVEVDCVFKKPASVIEDTSNQMFRQVNQYMDFLVKNSKPTKILKSVEQDQKQCRDVARPVKENKEKGKTREKRDSSSRSQELDLDTKKRRTVSVSDLVHKDQKERSRSSGREGEGKHKYQKRHSNDNDMYSPTRPTEHDDGGYKSPVEGKKRKSSKTDDGEGTKKQKREEKKKDKSRKDSKERSRSRSKSKGKDSKKKNKEKKHKKEKEKGKHKKKDIKEKTSKLKNKDSKKEDRDRSRERKDSENKKYESTKDDCTKLSQQYDIFDYRIDTNLKDASQTKSDKTDMEPKKVDFVAYPTKYSVSPMDANEQKSQETIEVSKTAEVEENDSKDVKLADTPIDHVKPVAPKKDVQPPITHKQREQAKEKLKKTSEVFFKDPVLLKVLKQLSLLPVSHEAFEDESPIPLIGLYDNTYALSWCVLQFFMDKNNVKIESSISGRFDLTQFIIKEMDPENSFMWALLLALHEHITNELKKREHLLKDDIDEHNIEIDKKNAESSKGITDTTSNKAEIDDGHHMKSTKGGGSGGNKLMQAFRQAVQFKKIQEKGGNRSTFAKLTPEQASKKPPKTPKAPMKSLFKPPIAYTLEITKSGHETNVEKEFYSIAEITKLNDLGLMDNLVRNAIEIFISHTAELLKINASVSVCDDIEKCLQPIVLKSVSNIRNLLIIATNLLGMYTTKQGSDLLKFAESRKSDVSQEVKLDILVEGKTEASEPEEGELTAGSTPSQHGMTDVNEYGSVVSNLKVSTKMVNLNEYGSVNTGDVVDEYGTVVDFKPCSEDSADVNEYGSSLLDKKQEIPGLTLTIENDVKKVDTDKKEIKMLIKNKFGTSTTKPMEFEDVEASDEETKSKRRFRKRAASRPLDKGKSQDVLPKGADLVAIASGVDFDASGKLVEESDEAAESALKKLRKIASQPPLKSTLDKRIEALIGDEKVTPEPDNIKEEDGISILKAENPVVDELSAGENIKLEMDEILDTNSGDSFQDVTDKKALVVESVVAVKGITQTVVRKNRLFQAFRQQKSLGINKSSCTSSQKVTASDILARLQEKTAPSQKQDTISPTVEEPIEPTTMEIENVYSPVPDELDEELYQQALSKESESLDVIDTQSPMEMSPVGLSTETSSDIPVKSGAPVIYSKEEQTGEGIKSLSQAVPSQDTTQFAQVSSDIQFSTPGTRLPAVVPSTSDPVDIPLPSKFTSEKVLSKTTESVVTESYSTSTYYGEPSVYTQSKPTTDVSTNSAASTTGTYFGDQTSAILNPNQYAQYPPRSEAQNLPAYDATQPTYSGTVPPYVDPNSYGGYPPYDQYSQGYGGYYDNTNYGQGWNPYYGPPGDWSHTGWGPWGNHDPSQWGSWGPSVPPPNRYDHGGMPVPPPDFSVPPPGFVPPKPKAPPPSRSEGNGKQPLLGPGGSLSHRMPPPAVKTSPQKKNDGLKNIRFYVFNKERKLTEVVEVLRYLQSVGSIMFDPFNIESTLHIPGIEIMIFIHSADNSRINEIPNLLQLRQETKIQFCIYQDIQDIRAKRFQSVMEKGGVLLVDDSILLEIIPESLENIMKFMIKKSDDGVPWTIQVHKHSLEEITKVRCLKPTESKDYQRLTKVQEILDSYQDKGLVNILPEHQCDNNLKPPQEYLQCAITQQSRNFQKYRDLLFLTNIPSNNMLARPFLENGVAVVNVADFLKNIAGHAACPAQVSVNVQNFGLREEDCFSDVYQSSAIDRISTPDYDPIEIQIRFEEELTELEEIENLKQKSESCSDEKCE